MYAARRAERSNTAFSSVSENSASAEAASPILPAALILGAMVNARVCASALSCDFVRKFEKHFLGEVFMSFSPSATISRFSPIRGTLSATVARAAKSRYLYASLPHRAHATLNATPAPHRLSYG